MVDSVYGHTGNDFAYAQLYNALGGDLANPFIGGSGAFGTLDGFFEAADAGLFLFASISYWLDTFHVDGFRFDDVPEYWDGPTGIGVRQSGLFDLSVRQIESGRDGSLSAFFDAAGNINLIQIAEYLPAPPDILNGSYSTGTWQDGTLGAAASCAAGSQGAIEQLGLQLG